MVETTWCSTVHWCVEKRLKFKVLFKELKLKVKLVSETEILSCFLIKWQVTVSTVSISVSLWRRCSGVSPGFSGRNCSYITVLLESGTIMIHDQTHETGQWCVTSTVTTEKKQTNKTTPVNQGLFFYSDKKKLILSQNSQSGRRLNVFCAFFYSVNTTKNERQNQSFSPQTNLQANKRRACYCYEAGNHRVPSEYESRLPSCSSWFACIWVGLEWGVQEVYI